MTRSRPTPAPPRKKVRRRDPEQEQLLQTLAQTRVLINQAYCGFNTAHAPELIESFVFEINALQCRYSYLLRRIKELEPPCERPASAARATHDHVCPSEHLPSSKLLPDLK